MDIYRRQELRSAPRSATSLRQRPQCRPVRARAKCAAPVDGWRRLRPLRGACRQARQTRVVPGARHGSHVIARIGRSSGGVRRRCGRSAPPACQRRGAELATAVIVGVLCAQSDHRGAAPRRSGIQINDAVPSRGAVQIGVLWSGAGPTTAAGRPSPRAGRRPATMAAWCPRPAKRRRPLRARRGTLGASRAARRSAAPRVKEMLLGMGDTRTASSVADDNDARCTISKRAFRPPHRRRHRHVGEMRAASPPRCGVHAVRVQHQAGGRSCPGLRRRPAGSPWTPTA